MNTAKVFYEKGKFRQEILVGNHHLVADVKTGEGGEDAGPSPHDYLATALGACTAITLRMYAVRKSWPLENAEVTVTFNKEGVTSKLDRKIHLVGPLDDTQKERLLGIANQCPVHKTLTGKIEITTTLV